MPYKVGAEVATKIAKVTYKGITDEIKRPKMGDVQKYVVSKAAKELERNNKMRTNALYVSSLKSNNNYRKII